MRFENSFRVIAEPDAVLKAMLDIPSVAGCLPGATVGAQKEDGSYEASIAVKVGPIRMTYGGTVRVTASDEITRSAALLASGREQRGQGTAQATIDMRVEPDHGGSRVQMKTDMQVTGRVAQMGAGMMQEVANTMVGEFADCLQRELGTASALSGFPVGATAAVPNELSHAAHKPVASEVRPLPLLFRAVAAKITRILRRQ